MKKLPTHLSFTLLILLLLTACAVPAPTATTTDATTAPAEETTTANTLFPLTITDAAGQEFTFDAPPKIGCWWTGCIEVFADLGLRPQAATTWLDEGYDSQLFFPAGPPVHEIQDSANPEEWAAAAVDLLVMRLPVSARYDALKAAAPIFYLHAPSYGQSDQTGYQAYLENLRIGGQLTDQPEAAAAAIARFDTMMANLKQLATPETAAQTVAILWEDEAYRAVDNTNPFCTIIGEAGLGTCIEAPLWEEINPEAFLTADPDLILYLSGSEQHQERTDPVWSQLSAVKNGRVYGVSGLYYCCGARTMYHDVHEYVHLILPDALPAPGPFAAYDPATSPLVQPLHAAATANIFPVTIEHKWGSTTIAAKPTRVVTLGFTDQDYLLALGVVPVGIREWFGGQPNAVWPWARPLLNGAEPEVLPRELNFEQIARLHPDLIVAIYTSLTREEYDLLSAIAPVVTAPPDLADYVISWQEQTRYTGQIVGEAARAEALVTQLEAKLAQARADHPEFEGVEYAFASVYGGEYYLYGEQSTASRFLTALGFVVPADILELTANDNDYLVFSAERMDLVDRPLVVWSEGPIDEGVVALLANPLYMKLAVHSEGRDLFLGLDLYGGAFSFSSILSLDLLVDDLVPAIALALDGDPATAPTLGR